MTKTNEWKLLIATSDESEAHLLRNRLASEGISCKVKADSAYPGCSHGGHSREIQIYVPVTEFEASQQAIELDELEDDIQ